MAFYNPYQAPSYTYNPTGYNGSTPYAYGSYPQQPQQQSNNGQLLTVFVNNEAEVNDYPVAAGTTVQLISFKMGKFYLKSTATNGVPQPIRIFRFEEETQAVENQNGAVSREEFNALNDKLDKLLKELGGEG